MTQQELLKHYKSLTGFTWSALADSVGLSRRALQTYILPDGSKGHRSMPEVVKVALAATHNNWQSLVKECEPLFGKEYTDKKGFVWQFFGLVHGGDDYYYGMCGVSNKGDMTLLSCVGSIESFGFSMYSD